MNAVLGASAVLECRVSGSAPISVGWFQDGNELISGPKCQSSFSENVCTLNLHLLEPSDTGIYTCVAANVAGSDECSAMLTVQGQCARGRGVAALPSGPCDMAPASCGISSYLVFICGLSSLFPEEQNSSHLDFFFSLDLFLPWAIQSHPLSNKSPTLWKSYLERASSSPASLEARLRSR